MNRNMNYVFIVLESARTDLLSNNYSHLPFLRKVDELHDFSNSTYVQYPNTVKSAVQFLCNRVPFPNYGFGEFE